MTLICSETLCLLYSCSNTPPPSSIVCDTPYTVFEPPLRNPSSWSEGDSLCDTATPFRMNSPLSQTYTHHLLRQRIPQLSDLVDDRLDLTSFFLLALNWSDDTIPLPYPPTHNRQSVGIFFPAYNGQLRRFGYTLYRLSLPAFLSAYWRFNTRDLGTTTDEWMGKAYILAFIILLACLTCLLES
jgi:hypothetical protein